MTDKGAVIMLEYGIEAFAPKKELSKEDGSSAKMDEKIMFEVTDFNKTAKKIILSHSKMHVEEEVVTEDSKKAAKTAPKKTTTKRTKISLEKTTLGDISDLAELKQKLEDEERNSEDEE
jgi:small subunit ribosomal protein S1